MKLRLLLLSATIVLAASSAYFLLPLPGRSAPLSQRIDTTQAQIDRARRREGVLTSTIAAYGPRIARLTGEVDALERRRARAEAELGRRRAILLETRVALARARERLDDLRERLAAAERALAARLVAIYKTDEPDALTVVLQADGFADLLERAEFLDRVAEQDERVVTRVRVLKDEARRQARRLAELEAAAERAANEILARRNEIAASERALVQTRSELATARSQRARTLARVRAGRTRAEEDLAALEREQARVLAQLRASQRNAFAPAAGPVRRGSGQLIWPIDGALTSPFGQRWGRLHAGIDIAAPEGTPIRAADSGRVVLAAYTGGYGNYTCIQHTSTLSSCYAHQSRFATSQGAAVGQGDVVGYVGNTGNSFGAHLHFEVRVNGQPVDPLGYL